MRSVLAWFTVRGASFLTAGIVGVLAALVLGSDTMVSVGALLGFLLVHLSVIKHFRRAAAEGYWIRYLAMPAMGALIVGYILWSTPATAKLAGGAWMAIGSVVAWRRGGRTCAANVNTHGKQHDH